MRRKGDIQRGEKSTEEGERVKRDGSENRGGGKERRDEKVQEKVQ